MRNHVCEEAAIERLATHEAPYHYVGAGLSNVFLTGVKYWVCSVCGMQSAEIPSLKELLKSLARTIVEKRTPLSGEEIRFLRKRLGKKSLEFAGMLGCTPENYSKIENSSHDPSNQMDRLVRLIYGFFSGDKKLATDLHKNFGQWITSLHGDGKGERIMATRVNSRQWVIQAELQAA